MFSRRDPNYIFNGKSSKHILVQPLASSLCKLSNYIDKSYAAETTSAALVSLMLTTRTQVFSRPHTLQMFHPRCSRRSVNDGEVFSFITSKPCQWEFGLRTRRCRLLRTNVRFKEKQIIEGTTERKSITLLKSFVICLIVLRVAQLFI